MSYLRLKRCLDVVGALLLLVLAVAPMLVAAILVRLTSRGPVIFRQERAGIYGRPFIILKFRTMADRPSSQATLCRTWRDPRVTAVGKLLRASRFDELPQLFNVLRGEMSLVGPRPLPITMEVEQLAKYPDYCRRWEVRPGIVSQVRIVKELPNALDGPKYFTIDMEYIEHMSLVRDLSLLARTPIAIVRIARKECDLNVASPELAPEAST